jgi:hypothetical protein
VLKFEKIRLTLPNVREPKIWLVSQELAYEIPCRAIDASSGRQLAKALGYATVRSLENFISDSDDSLRRSTRDDAAQEQ